MFLPESNSLVQFALFGVILLSIGIPHGAIDHLISNPKIDRKGLGRFLLIYLTLIAAYLSIWYFLPILALIAFLAMSAYHFGQSHFISENPPKQYSWLLFATRGGFFLFAILFGDWEATKLILSPLVNLEYLAQSKSFILVAFLLTTLLFQEISGCKFQKRHILEIVVLGPILFYSPLLIRICCLLWVLACIAKYDYRIQVFA